MLVTIAGPAGRATSRRRDSQERFMSTPTVPPASPNNPTRQLLDELDALMERMLALPVEDHEGEPLPPPPRSLLFREPAAPAVARIELPPNLADRLELIQPV